MIVEIILSIGSTAIQEVSEGSVHVLDYFDEDDNDETLGLSMDEQEEAPCLVSNADSGGTSRSSVGSCFASLFLVQEDLVLKKVIIFDVVATDLTFVFPLWVGFPIALLVLSAAEPLLLVF